MGLGYQTLAATRPYFSSDNVWYFPLYQDYLDNNRSGIFFTPLFTTTVYRRGVYLPSAINPPDGAIYAGDPNYAYHFPVVRQGRYLMYGFYEIPNTYTTTTMGKMFFVNLIARMDDF